MIFSANSQGEPFPRRTIMPEKKKKEEKKGLLDKLEEAVFPKEKRREEAEEKEKQAMEQARQAQMREEESRVRAAEEARKKAETEARVQAAEDQRRKAMEEQSQKAMAEQRQKEMEEQRNRAEEQRRRQDEVDRMARAQQAIPATGGAAKEVRKHKVKAGETLSHLALKYYGSAARDEYMKIYEANKEIIGDNPNLIREGQELVIP